MNKVKTLLITFSLGFAASVAIAEGMGIANTQSMDNTSQNMTIDPTLAFFSALSTCTPGTYTEKNILLAEVGRPELKQQIIGQSDDDLVCNAILMTPDNRTLTCAFPMHRLMKVNEQRFLEGVLEATTDSPSQNALNSDMIWSQIKAESCSLDSY